MENLEIPGRIQMERFIPVEIFRKKSNTFGGITFFPFLPKRPKFSVPFVWIISARLHVERKRKIYRYFVNVTIQSFSRFQCPIIPVPFDGNFSRNFRTNGKRSLFWYNPSCFVMQIVLFLCYKLEFSKHNFHKKRKEVWIKTRSTSSSRLLKGSNSKPLTVKWSIIAFVDHVFNLW